MGRLLYLQKKDMRILDAIRKTVDSKVSQSFYKKRKISSDLISDNDYFRMISEKRAYSATRSNRVDEIRKSGMLSNAFCDWDVARACRLKENDVIAKHWPLIKAIRFPKKVKEIIDTAKAIENIRKKYGSFSEYLDGLGRPEKIRCKEDIELFWDFFENLISNLKKDGVPIISKEITLLHFLSSDLNMFCLKPDVVVMKVMKNTGIIPRKMKNKERMAVKKIQEYSLIKEIRPQIMDRYLLVFGGQSSAIKYVKGDYKGDCKKKDGCGSAKCLIGKKKLCPTRYLEPVTHKT